MGTVASLTGLKAKILISVGLGSDRFIGVSDAASLRAIGGVTIIITITLITIIATITLLIIIDYHPLRTNSQGDYGVA